MILFAVRPNKGSLTLSAAWRFVMRDELRAAIQDSLYSREREMILISDYYGLFLQQQKANLPWTFGVGAVQTT
jgi:hypothetical protein